MLQTGTRYTTNVATAAPHRPLLSSFCLQLFSCDAVTKKDMFALVQDLFGAAHQELFEEFKLLMATRANYDAQPSDMWCVCI